MCNNNTPLTEYLSHPNLPVIKRELQRSNNNIYINGLSGSSLSILSTAIKESSAHLIIASDKEDASYIYHDLTQLNPKGDIYFMPSSFKRSPEFGQPDKSQKILRTEALQNIRTPVRGQFFITYTEAVMEKVPEDIFFNDKTITLKNQEKIDIQFLTEFLNELGFKREDFVYEPGTYAVRGSIIDIFSFAKEEPYRIDFFGEEVESIRSFDIETQLSKESLNKITIIPDLAPSNENEKYTSFFNLLKENITIWIEDPEFTISKIETIFNKTIKEKFDKKENKQGVPHPTNLIDGKAVESFFNNQQVIIWGKGQERPNSNPITFNISHQPKFHKQFNLVEENIQKYISKGYQIKILSNNPKQLERLKQIFTDRGSKINYHEVSFTLHEGFIDHDIKLCAYTDHQIFDRFHKFSLKTDKTRSARQAISLKELTQLNPGDYVVHTDHGIGKFGGLITLEESGKKQEAIQLIYKDNDVLLVNIHSLHRISKYKGKDSEPPKTNKLGTATWSRKKDKTKKKVKDIARELIALYAARKEEPGYAFSGDSYMQKELEASFMYEDTPDQQKSTIAVKSDMEEKNPMDRLVCGDVGFGKTEVAIRAAFKAISDNKQVALLVPTTILALQHYHTFKERLKDFPCRVEYISRLRKASEIKKIINETKEGKVDILIGTHRLVGKDVGFKDLGLLIVDEEQKFGVSVKEKLKQLKLNVDTLTLTATPIPRTLQFSLMGARDLSVLNTPPPNRHPIYTELHTFNKEIIKEAIIYEVERNGQVFFINNRVQNIIELQSLINRMLPDIRTVVAHGQMEGKKLEQIMLDFINGEYNVLIATTIIESGLDIPNANTMIINNAHHFGLSELHQLRGRVGRSNKKAFCYLLAPPLSTITSDARRRLKILEEFSELGSGFNIAMQDLDIRGAGNLLGGEQSGFIEDIGYETYQRILEEALLELKESEYPELIKESNKKEGEEFKFVADCQIETDDEVRFPDSYISNISERMNLYRELDNIKNIDKLSQFRDNITDRFGKLPNQAEKLLEVVKIRIKAQTMGIEKLTYKNRTVRINFVSNKESPFYSSPIFTSILNWVQNNPLKMKMEERSGKLWLIIPKIKDIREIKNVLDQMSSTQK
ncbi:transcription-repair coupling factor [Marinilabiliaceae bacterium ANBcel2]|nr:transcription-repair coupling factor [Marinilabiliaceae bacterium ANBcel2]